MTQDDRSKRFRTWAKEFENYESFANKQFDYTLTTIRDLDFLRAGKKLLFAVDFAELYSYAFPFSTKMIGPTKLKDDLRGIARSQIALSFVFSDELSKKLLLLPPYLVELRDKMGSVARHAMKGYEVTHLGDEIIRKFTSKNRLSLLERAQSILESYVPGSSELNDEDWHTLTSFVQVNFMDLFLAAEAFHMKGAKTISGLVNSGKLQTISDFWESTPIEVDLIAQHDETKALRSLFSKKRKSLHQVRSNYLDALALQMIKEINKERNSNGELLLLVTHSHATKEVADEKIKIDLEGYEGVTGITRNLDLMLNYLVHREGEKTDHREAVWDQTKRKLKITLNWLEAYRAELEKIRELSNNLRNEELDRPVSIVLGRKAKHAIETLENVKQKYEEFSNLKLVLRRKPSLTHFVGRLEENERNALNIVREVIEFIDRPAMQIRLNDEFSDIFRDLYLLRDKLRRISDIDIFAFPAIFDELTIEEYYHQGNHKRKTVVVCFIRDSRCTIQLYDENIQKIALRIAKDAKSKVPKSIGQALDSLISIVDSPEIQPEGHLLLALVYGSLNKVDSALNEIKLAFSDQRDLSKINALFSSRAHRPNRVRHASPSYHEIYYLEANLLYSIGKVKDALVSIQNALAFEPKDPRFLHLISYLIWLDNVYGNIRRAGNDGDSQKRSASLDLCIRYAEAALQNVHSDVHLKARILNNLAWFYLEKALDLENPVSLIDSAQSFIFDLLALSNEYPEKVEWTIELSTTIAFLTLQLGDPLKAKEQLEMALVNERTRPKSKTFNMLQTYFEEIIHIEDDINPDR